MAKRSFYDKYYKDTQPWAKSVINVLVVGGTIYAAYKIYSYFKEKADIAEANTQADQADADLKKLAAKGIFPSYVESQYEGLSQTLVQAMTGCGSDEDMVIGVFEIMKNDADVLMLVKAFGVRFYQPCLWWSPVSYSIWLANDHAFGGGISTWLGYDLSQYWINKINTLLASKGISYQF